MWRHFDVSRIWKALLAFLPLWTCREPKDPDGGECGKRRLLTSIQDTLHSYDMDISLSHPMLLRKGSGKWTTEARVFILHTSFQERHETSIPRIQESIQRPLISSGCGWSVLNRGQPLQHGQTGDKERTPLIHASEAQRSISPCEMLRHRDASGKFALFAEVTRKDCSTGQATPRPCMPGRAVPKSVTRNRPIQNIAKQQIPSRNCGWRPAPQLQGFRV